jgi:hypothetical protein
VADELPRLGTRGRKPHPIHHVIKAPLKQCQQIFARDALFSFGQCKQAAKLPFKNTVNSFELLLLSQLYTVFSGFFPSPLTMLARRICATFDCAFVSIAAFAFEK